MCDVIGSIWSGYVSLPLRGWVINDSNLQITIRGCEMTFWHFSKPRGQTLIAKLISRLKKTWHTASFEPRSEVDDFLRSEQSPSELAGPGSLLYYSIAKFGSSHTACLHPVFLKRTTKQFVSITLSNIKKEKGFLIPTNLKQKRLTKLIANYFWNVPIKESFETTKKQFSIGTKQQI